MTVIKNKLSKTIKGADKKGDFDISYLLLASEEGNYLKSTDYAKTLDVLCEGPIEGFIDREGERVYGSDVLKAIYLDGNPIKTSADEYNFQNISVDYRLGLENQDSIPRYSKPIINTEVNAPLLGAFIPGDVNNSPESKRKAEYSYEFEYYSDQEARITKKTESGNHSILEFRTEFKTLTNITVLDPGKGYDDVTTAEPKFEPEYNEFQTFNGRIEEEPIFDITYNAEGGVNTISILNGGRFNAFDSYTGYSGTAPIEQWYVSGTITGNILDDSNYGQIGLDDPDYLYRGSGSITYDEYRPDEFGSLVAANVTETGFFDTLRYRYLSLFNEIYIYYYGYLPKSGGFTYDHYFVQGSDRPPFPPFSLAFEGPTAYTGYSGILDPLYISGRTTELVFDATVEFPTSDLNLAVLGQTDTDIRSNQEDYAGWNTNKSQPYDYFPYTHIITNNDVDSVDLVVNIARLNDTQYEADSIFEIWKEPEFSIFGGADDGEGSVAFSIGRPEDSFVKFKVEIGFTNTNYGKETFEYVVNGQTVEGYLKELKDINLPTYKGLSSELFSSSLPELKSRYKRYVKITKHMFETDSVLINRDVSLSSIKEKINSNFRYPFSTLVGTTIDSRTFETVPVRTYNAQLKRIKAPENYKPLTKDGLDKRFQPEEKNYNGLGIVDVSTFTHEHAYPTFGISAARSSYGKCISAHKESYVLSWEDFGKGEAGIPDQSYGNLFYFPGDGTREAIKAGTTRYQTLSFIKRFQGDYQTFDFVYPKQTSPYIQNQLTLQPFVGEQWEFNQKTLVATIIVGGNYYTTPPIDVEFYSTKISMSMSDPYLYVGPGKLSLLEFNCSWEVHPDTTPDAMKATAEGVGGIVVGFVENMSDPKPKYIIRKINRPESFNKQIVEIYHEDRKPLYVKFFAVQLYPLSQARIDRKTNTEGPDGIINSQYNIEDELKKVDEDDLDYGYADTGGDAGLQLRPYSMRISNLKMEEDILGNFYSLGDEFVELSDQYIICDATRNGAFGVIDKYVILVVKRDKATKTWHFFQEIESWDSQPINGVISEDERRIIFHTRSSDSTDKPIKVYDFDDSTKQFERTALIARFEGDFKGQRMINSSSNRQSWMASPDRNTIIIHEPQSRLVNEINSTNYNVVLVYKEINGIFSLHQLIQPPDSENLGTTWPAVDAKMDWLIVGYRGHRNDESLRSDGSAALFRYNGKIYEYVKTFWGDQVTDPVLGSIVFIDENFGATVAMGQNKNGDVQLAITSELNAVGEKSRLYIYEIHPDKDEFAEWSINTTSELFDNRIAESQRGMDLDGSNVLVYMEKTNSDFPNQVLKINKKSPKYSKRIYEDALGWNGILQEKWTDNPVWIVYDMLTNPVYGAGVALDDLEDINIFNFYNLGKYFDSVDEKGFFIPLYDERGSTEPRFSCNFLLKESFNAFDVINSITDLFFGALYLSNGQYNLWADVPTETTFFFNNEDVVDGNFTYSDKPKNERTTIIEVPYLDKYDDFKPKIEYIEDSVLMRENGKISKRLEFGAFTTRSQARRFGKQYIYNSSYETEKITFETDDKALFLNPGDVIGVNDDLKRFSTEKMFWSVDQVIYEEKIHIVQHPSGTSSTSGFLYSEATLNDGELSNAKWDFKQIKTINGNGSTQYPTHFDLKTDNNGTPYILAQSTNNISLYRKMGDSFDRLSFTNLDDPYASSLQCESYIDFDSNNVPYISLIGNGVYNNGADQGVGFMKLVGNNFSDPASWQVRYIDEIDPLQEGFEVDRRISKIKIDDLNNIYLLTRVRDVSPNTGELNLYKINESSNYFAKYRFGEIQNSADDMRFDIQLKNGTTPAIAYKASEGPVLRLDPHIFYTEYVAGNFEDPDAWNNVFVHGTEDMDQDDIKLSFNKNIPFISNSSHLEDDIRIYTPLTGDRWNHANWATNKTFITQPAIYSAAPLIFLGNNDPVLFKTDYNISNGDRKKGLSTFQFKEDLSKFQMTQKWEFNQVYGHENVPALNGFVNSPSVDNFITQPPKITLLNSRRDFFDNDFELDLTINNNLELNYLGGADVDLKNLYNKTQFEDFIVNEDFEVTKSFLTITGYEESGSYLNLYPRINKESIEAIQLLKAKGTLVRPVKAKKKPTEYRVLNIIEKDQNLFEVQGREFHSEKFSAIESAENISSPLQEIYNIGIPSHEINKPSEPIGISYDVGTDEGGGAFVIGSITGEVNGSETKYRLSITSPNLKYKYIEIEKDFENLSPQNEPITNYGFYNLNQPGEYELTVKSLRNPESSTFISQKFEIEFGEKVSDKPYISSINIFNKDEYIKLEIDTRNVYGDKFELTNGKASIDIKLNGVLWQADRTIKTFETSLQELKEFCGLNHRAIVIDVELFYDGAKVSEITKTLTDKPPRINNAEFLSDGVDSLIKFDMEDDFKLRLVSVYYSGEKIKTHQLKNQNQTQIINFYDFEIEKIPVSSDLSFSLIPEDVYGTGQSFDISGFIPEKQSSLDIYNESIITIYSINSQDQSSGVFDNFNSSNGLTKFYGTNRDSLIEFSSSLASGYSGSISAKIISDTDSKDIPIEFDNLGFKSTKKITNLLNEEYSVYISGQYGLFDGYELKIKKL